MRIPRGASRTSDMSSSGSPSQERNPFSGLPLNTTVPLDAGPIHMDRTGNLATSVGMSDPGTLHLASGMNEYHENTNIRYWMSSSAAAGSYEGHAYDDDNSSPSSSDVVQGIHALHNGSLPVSRVCSQSSTDYASSMQALDTVASNGSALGVSCLPSPQSGDQFGLGFSPDHGYGISLEPESQSAMALDYSIGTTPTTGSMEGSPFTNASAGDNGPIAPFSHEWTSSGDYHVSQANGFNGSGMTAWSTMCLDSSSSPQCSIPDGPGTMAVSDDPFWTEENARMHSSFNLRPNAPMLPSAMHLDPESTVRPSHGHHRPSIPGPQAWQMPQDAALAPYRTPISTFPGSSRSSEGENVSARRDPLYQLKASKDGRYRCVFVDKDGKKCDNEPFRLKCNYDKHLDSHLKPYRCKWPNCKEGSFSSTACLLRHEREAHGMHGHMEILCLFEGCDRSVPGKGFPRKWNAQDHMKRVHQWQAPEGSGSGDGSPPSSGDTHGAGGPAGKVGKKRGQAPKPSNLKKPRSDSKSSGKTSKRDATQQYGQSRKSPGTAWPQQDMYMTGFGSEVSPESSGWADATTMLRT